MAQSLMIYLRNEIIVIQQIDIKRIHHRSISRRNVPLIVLVEDDELVRLSIGRFFSLFDYSMKKYASAEKAFDDIRCCAPDIIITDYNLPGMNGLELTKRIRKIGITTPVVLLSAIRSIDIDNCSLALGIDAIFTKPVNILDLKERIEELISLQFQQQSKPLYSTSK